MQIRHKEFLFPIGEAIININSQFDSGNLESATLSNGKLVLSPALDPMNPQYSTKSSSKTFFHFKIAANCSIAVDIAIQRMNILSYFPNDQVFEELYRICLARRQKNTWSQITTYQKVKLQGTKRVQIDGNCELHFTLPLNQHQQIFLAYHYPYPYQKSIRYLQEVKDRIATMNTQHDANVYFTNELLIQSLERRSVSLLTLTDSTHIQDEDESRISKSLFPYHQIEGRPKRFNKPYILLTCRVHAGETSSSYALQGIINFLLDQDKRAKLLLKNFVFLVVPILNPDGVFHGTYRMDTHGHNLNRFYNSAQSHRQPSVFAVQTLVNYYGSRIVFSMDLHSHAHPNKGSFIYGNCLQQIEDQTESQLFAKLLSLQSQCFGYHWCSFSNSQMNSRDINEILTKDGCARVQVYRILNIPFAYTMEMGYYGCPIKERDEETQPFTGDERRVEKVFSIQDYRKNGKSAMIALLNLFMMGSSGGAKHEHCKYYQQCREDICKELVQKQERFRQADSFVFKKIKNIGEIIAQQYYEPFYKQYPFIDTSFNKYVFLNDKKICIPKSIYQTIDVPKAKHSTQKRQISLNFKSISKTIDTSRAKQKDFAIKSFKSTCEPRQKMDISHFTNSIQARQQNFQFAKQLNLDFNPFPSTQRRRIYNIIGNRRSPVKKTIANQIQHQNRENCVYDNNDVTYQIEAAQQLFKDVEKDEFRHKMLGNYNPNAQKGLSGQEGAEYNDGTWQNSKEQQHFVLPKIPIKSERIEKMFNIEVQFQRQYDHKYQIHERKDLTPVYTKPTLRSNSLRMRSLLKSNK